MASFVKTCKNGTMHINNNLIKLGRNCPICGTEYELRMNACAHPNSMFSVTSCCHINLTGFSNEEETIEELNIVIEELLSKIN